MSAPVIPATALADEPAREAARRNLAASLLVEAGAGTGKTTLIVERIANLVDAGVPIDHIVAITFTEKAAGELKLRVRRALELRAADPALDDAARRRARGALEAIERAAISTIHAWCARLLREHPVESGVDPLFTVLDGNARELLFDQVWERWLSRALAHAEPPPPIAEISLYTADEWVRELRALAKHVLEHRAWLPQAMPPELGGDPIADAEAALGGLDVDGLRARCKDPDDKLVAALAAAGALRARYLAAPTRALRAEILLRQEDLGKSGYAKVGQQGNWGGAAGIAVPRAAITAAQEAWIAARARLANDLLARIVRWLVDGFVADYEAEKQRAGALDFEDLLVRARNLLRDNAAVRRRVRRGLRLILDEFQDTDPVQCETAFRLAAAGEPARWEDATPAEGSLFLVGDPKQSIYAFRGADVETYSTARELFAARGAVREISTNFRSRESVLAWVNACFGRLLVPSADPETSRFQIGYAPLGVHWAANAEGNGVHVLRPDEGVEFEKVWESREAEARAVAALLRDEARGKWIVRDPKTGADRPARYGDMVVLLRNRKSSLHAFERAFRAAQIPFVVVGGRALWARAEVRALTALCRAIENPFDGVSLVAALKSAFFGASDADLLLHKHRHGSLSAHARLADGGGEDGSTVAAALARIARWHRERLEMPPARLLEHIFAETGAIASFGLKPDGAQRISNLLRLLDAARLGVADVPGGNGEASAAGAPLSFRAWVGWLSDRATDVREEAEGAILEEDADAVRILTMHAAKGLEFPVVVLGDLGVREHRVDPRLFDRGTHRLAVRVSARDVALETANFEAAKEGTKARQEAEDLRLLYVAATRARDALVIPLFPSRRTTPSFLKTLVDAFPALGEARTELAAGEGGPARVWTAREEPAPVDALPAHAPREHSVRADDGGGSAPGNIIRPVAGEPPVFRLPVEPLSEALETELRRVAAAGAPPLDPDARALAVRIEERIRPRAIRSVTHILPTDETLPYTPANTGLTAEEARLVGTTVHAALEHGDLGDADDLEKNARLQARARMLSTAATERAAKLARAAATMPPLVRARTAARTMREWPFMLPIDAGFFSAGAWLLEGIIDLAWVEDGELVILDYKTDALPPGDAAAVAGAATHHAPQLLAYAWAASRITGLKVRSIIVALLDAGHAVERRVTDADLRDARTRIEAAFAAPAAITAAARGGSAGAG